MSERRGGGRRDGGRGEREGGRGREREINFALTDLDWVSFLTDKYSSIKDTPFNVYLLHAVFAVWMYTVAFFLVSFVSVVNSCLCQLLFLKSSDFSLSFSFTVSPPPFFLLLLEKLSEKVREFYEPKYIFTVQCLQLLILSTFVCFSAYGMFPEVRNWNDQSVLSSFHFAMMIFRRQV